MIGASHGGVFFLLEHDSGHHGVFPAPAARRYPPRTQQPMLTSLAPTCCHRHQPCHHAPLPTRDSLLAGCCRRRPHMPTAPPLALVPARLMRRRPRHAPCVARDDEAPRRTGGP
uniref:Uncharacterized protein n=1 Tax=Setaria viridis TaxID=4556 RepID=A0A4U6WDG0_SETVI|nr:hypothetical protein SEVIR_1G254350v2 [Setaria viridis]